MLVWGTDVSTQYETMQLLMNFAIERWLSGTDVFAQRKHLGWGLGYILQGDISTLAESHKSHLHLLQAVSSPFSQQPISFPSFSSSYTHLFTVLAAGQLYSCKSTSLDPWGGLLFTLILLILCHLDKLKHHKTQKSLNSANSIQAVLTRVCFFQAMDLVLAVTEM